MYRQDPPFAIQLESVLGCNLSCDFCGINGIGYGNKANGLKFMTPQTAECIAQQIAEAGWTSRLEFALRGEPLLNPEVGEVVAAFRQHLPKSSITLLTNGGPLVKDPLTKINGLFDAGLNRLVIEQYKHAPFFTKIRERLPADLPFPVVNCPADGQQPTRMKPRERVLQFNSDPHDGDRGTYNKINNHGGYGDELVPYDKPCSKPFREMSIRWDGTVSYCCINWGGEGACGNVHEAHLQDIWNNERFHAVRQHLLHGMRTFMTCKGCNHPSYRSGLLPDKLGKRKDAYPVPAKNSKASRVIAAMEAEGFTEQPTPVYLNRKASFKP